jgi:hypothetical protein
VCIQSLLPTSKYDFKKEHKQSAKKAYPPTRLKTLQKMDDRTMFPMACSAFSLFSGDVSKSCNMLYNCSATKKGAAHQCEDNISWVVLFK